MMINSLYTTIWMSLVDEMLSEERKQTKKENMLKDSIHKVQKQVGPTCVVGNQERGYP